jgi:Putative adhesin
MTRTSHLSSIAAAIVLVTCVATSASAQERQPRAPQTDRNVPVTRGSRLIINNMAGEIVIKTWDRDSLRVQARHSARVTIDVATESNVVTIRSRGAGGPPTVDYEITAPVWLPVKASGQHAYIGIEGAQNEVSAETVSGDVVIKGGSGFVTAKSIQGEVIVEDAKGRINVSSVNEGITISGSVGEIAADSTNGDITMNKVDAKSVDASSVNGNIRYEGTLSSGGQFRFATHNGNVTLIIPETSNATFTVRTYNGEFSSNLATKVVGEVRRGRRATYILGNGSAEVEVESFSGNVRLRKPGTVAPPSKRDHDKDKQPGDAEAMLAGFGTELFESEQPLSTGCRNSSKNARSQ